MRWNRGCSTGRVPLTVCMHIRQDMGYSIVIVPCSFVHCSQFTVYDCLGVCAVLPLAKEGGWGVVGGEQKGCGSIRIDLGRIIRLERRGSRYRCDDVGDWGVPEVLLLFRQESQ